jgi:RimJ/RimL family protein N-acetyltransferase
MPWPAAATVETPRLRLEPLRVADAAAMAAVLADPALYPFTGGHPPSVDQLERRYVAQVTGGSADGSQWWLNWTVRRRPTSEVAGFVQATVQVRDGELVGDVAWVIGVRSQGQGLAAEAARGMIGWLRSAGVGRVTALIHPDHSTSMGVALSCGLTPTDEVVDGEVRWTS